MNYRYGFLAAALCGLLSLPAFAAVTDLDEGGSTSSHTDVVRHNKTNNVYTDSYSTVNDTAKDKNVYHDNSTTSSSTVYHGHVDSFELSAFQYNSYVEGARKASNGKYYKDYYGSFDKTSSNPSDIESWANGNFAYNAQGSGRTVSYSGGGWSAGSTSVQDNTKTTVDHKSYLKTTYSTKDTDRYTEYKLVNSTTTFTGVSTTNDFVAVGDPDDLVGSGYIANGHATYNYRQDDYYERDHVFNTEHITTNTTHTYDVITKTGSYNKVTTYELSKSISYSPIVLDLDGDGKIDASNGQYLAHRDNVSDKVAMFDFFGNGYPVLTEWVSANDGLLCRPAEDGSVKGTNLFGTANGFRDGYEEMAAYDANEDGVLSGEELTDLRVWVDANGDAIAQPAELKTLAELGITSLKVSHDNFKSTFVRNGQTFNSFDWWPTYKEARKVDLAAVITK